MTVAAPARWQPPSGRGRWQPLQGGQSVSQSVVSGRKAAATVRAGTTRRATGRLPASSDTRWAAGPAPGTWLEHVAAGRIRPVAQWQSCSNVGPKGGKAPRSSRIRVLTVCLAATPRVTAGALPARFDAGPGPRRCGGEILTFPDILTTQGLSLWSLNIVRWRTRYTGSCATRP